MRRAAAVDQAIVVCGGDMRATIKSADRCE